MQTHLFRKEIENNKVENVVKFERILPSDL